MFFWGLLVGGGIYVVGFLIYYFLDRPGWSIAVMVAACIAVTAVIPRLGGGSVAAVVVLFVVFYFVGKRLHKNDEQEPSVHEAPPPKLSAYKSHCWHCGNPIDGSWNKQCPTCKKYYICPKCGACKCDYPNLPPFHHDE